MTVAKIQVYAEYKGHKGEAIANVTAANNES